MRVSGQPLASEGRAPRRRGTDLKGDGEGLRQVRSGRVGSDVGQVGSRRTDGWRGADDSKTASRSDRSQQVD